MTIPSYTSVSVAATYNNSPPADDGSQVAANIIQWAAHVIAKVGTPLKNAIDSINTNVSAAISSIKQLGSTVTAKSSAYTIVAADDGSVIAVSGATTITLLPVATAGSGFRIIVLKTDAAGTTVTIDGDGSETINGLLTLSLTQRYEAVALYTNGTAWFAFATGLADLKMLDTNQTHFLRVTPGSNLTAERTFTLTTGDQASSLDISGPANVTISTTASTLLDDASVAAMDTTLGLGTTDTPRFAGLGIGQAATTNTVDITASSVGAAVLKSSFTGTSAQTRFCLWGQSADSTGAGVVAHMTHATYADTTYGVIQANATRAANVAYSLYTGYSGNLGDKEFEVTGDGILKSDQAATTPADYAEFFENAALGILPLGETVCLVNGKVALASANPLLPIIGVVRPRKASALVANAHHSRHHKKYEKDKWGAMLLTKDGDRVLSNNFDPNLKYIPREDRPAEWTIVGLLGQVPVLKSAPKPPQWVKMWAIDADAEMWLVR